MPPDPHPSDNDTPAIVIKDVWKIFGDNATEALASIKKENLGKSEVLSRFNCVVGVLSLIHIS